MKKVIIIFLILWLISLQGCSKNQELQEQQNSNTLSKTEIFNNNLKCQDYLNDFIKKYNPTNEYNESYQIFYSPIENNCIGTFVSLENNETIYNINIIDIINTNKQAHYVWNENWKSYYYNDFSWIEYTYNDYTLPEVKELWQKEIKRLKWE